MGRYLYLILLVVPALALPAQGGIFSKRAAPTPDKRVPELLYIVKADADEGKRAAAAAELRDYDTKKFPDMMLVLVDVLQNDTKPSVRREAAISLGRLRPISASAGQALQQAAAKDPSLRVRVQAWSSLKIYQLNGFNARMKDPPPPATPAADTVKLAPGTPKAPSVAAKPQTGKSSTKEPPLAEPGVKVSDLGQPVGTAPPPPRTSIFAPLAKQRQTTGSRTNPPPAPTPNPPVNSEGPMLVPQKD